MVVFDPPHLKNAGKNSWLGKKYGILEATWHDDIRQGFAEGMRVLKPFGTLILKWNEDQIKLKEIMPLFGLRPLFGHRSNKTHFLVFMKITEEAKCNEK